VLHRSDPSLNFTWTGVGPNPAMMRPDWWTARWSGTIKAPTGPGGGPGWYALVSVNSDDRVTVKSRTTTVLSAMTAGAYVVGSGIFLSDTTGTPIDVNYAQTTGPARLNLALAKCVNQFCSPPGSPMRIQPSWLAPDSRALLGGWSRIGDALVPDAYTALRAVSATTTAVVDDTGADHLYTSTSGAAWTPPPGEDGVLTRTTDGT
jgi:hypothetical protein